MLQGIIFDLDGTLVDSEIIWEQVLREIVESFGKTYDPAVHREVLGRGTFKAMEMMRERFDLPAPTEELERMLVEGYKREIAVKIPAKKPGIDVLLQSLSVLGIPCAVATSLERGVAEYVLAGHDWLSQFATVVTIEDVANGKPAPDIYAEAARRLLCGPNECVAFEDAVSGVKSAKAAGLKVVGLEDVRFGSKLDEADRVIESFEQITVDDLKAMLE